MKTKVFTPNDLRDLKVAAIARKHKCSVDYVRRVLLGDRERNTDLAKMIVVDAVDILAIVYSHQTSPLVPNQIDPL